MVAWKRNRIWQNNSLQKEFWGGFQHGLIRASWTLLVFANLRHVWEARLTSNLQHLWWKPLEVHALQKAQGHSARVFLHSCRVCLGAHNQLFSAKCSVTGEWAGLFTIRTSPALRSRNNQNRPLTAGTSSIHVPGCMQEPLLIFEPWLRRF